MNERQVQLTGLTVTSADGIWKNCDEALWVSVVLRKVTSMKLTTTQIVAIRNADLLRVHLAEDLQDQYLLNASLETLSSNQFGTLYDAAFGTLLNYSPMVEEFLAEQGKGVYPIHIMGVPGAYYVSAIEFDNEGVFDSLKDARSCVEFNHGEFLIQPDSHSEADQLEIKVYK